MQTRDILTAIGIGAAIIGTGVTVALVAISQSKKDNDQDAKQPPHPRMIPGDSPVSERAKREYELSESLQETMRPR